MRMTFYRFQKRTLPLFRSISFKKTGTKKEQSAKEIKIGLSFGKAS